MLEVLAPVAGTVIDVTDVPDPVFARGLVGPGAAIRPDPDTGRTAVAPVSGRIIKLHPHAFIIASDGGAAAREDSAGSGGPAPDGGATAGGSGAAPQGRAILVHLGIDTVELKGDGFTLLVAEGDDVVAGQPIAVWDPADVEARGRSAIVPVVALEAPSSALTAVAAPGTQVTGADLLFAVSG